MIASGTQDIKRQRNGTIDIMRLVASAGIVWFHAHAPGQMVSYSALSLFLVLLIVLPLDYPNFDGFATYVGGRAVRLLRPWLIWSGIFAGLKAAQAFVEHRPVMSEFDSTMFVMGTETHLWFLPFGFVCSVGAFAVARATSRNSRFPFAVACVLAVLLTPAGSLAKIGGLSSPLAEWAYGLSAVAFGMAIHFAHADQRKLKLVSLATLAGWGLTVLISGTYSSAGSMIIGVNLALLALTTPMASRRWTRWAADVSMLVYLSHPIFLALLQLEPIAAPKSAMLATAAIGLSLVFAAALLRSGLAKKLT